MNKLIVAVVSIFIGAGVFAQPESETRAPSRALHTVLVGSGDTSRVSSSFSSALSESAESKTIALVELAPETIDIGVLAKMLDDAKSRTCFLVIKIAGSDRVDARVLALAFAADACVIEDRVTFISKHEENPEHDDTEKIIALRTTMIESGTPESLARVLTFGARNACVDQAGNITLDRAADSSGDVSILRDGAIRIEHQTCARLGLNHHDETRMAWRAIGRTSVRIDDPSYIIVGADKIAADVDRRLADIRASLARMETALDLPDPSKHEVAPAKYRLSADRAMQIAEGVERILHEIEGVFQEAPEALAVAPAEEPILGSSASSYATAWKSRLRTQRTALERLKARAAEFASVKP